MRRGSEIHAAYAERILADVGIHGDTQDLDPHSYVCIQCLLERAHDPDPEPVLRLVA